MAFHIEIKLDDKGVQAVRVVGNRWEQRSAYELVDRLSPILDQIDRLAKAHSRSESPPQKRRLQ